MSCRKVGACAAYTDGSQVHVMVPVPFAEPAVPLPARVVTTPADVILRIRLLLQSATYLSALSGSSWLLTSLVQANFPLFQELIFGSNTSSGYAGWLAQFGVVAPTNSSTQNQEYIAGLIEEIKGKHDAGFPVTIADVWARALARHFVNGTSVANFFNDSSTHGAGITLSELANL